MRLLAAVLLSVSAGLAWGGPPTSAPTSTPTSVTDTNDVSPLRPDDLERGDRPRGGPGARWRGPTSRPFAGFGLLAFSRQMFRPLPEDFDPLQPGEGEALMAFAQERFPTLYEALAQLQQRNPERFRQRLEDSAPRLRHLQRVYQHSPKLGGLIRTHVENMLRVQRDVRTLRTVPAGSPEYTEAQQSIRDRLTDNVRLEIAALENLVEFAEREGDQRAEQRAGALLAADANLERLPPRLRELVNAYHAATDEEGRTTARIRLVDALRRSVTEEVSTLRTRLASVRAAQQREIEQRLERLLAGDGQDPNRPGRHLDPPHRGRP